MVASPVQGPEAPADASRVEETSLGKRLGRLAVVALAWAEVLLVAGVLVHVAAGRRTSIRVAHGRLPATVSASPETTVDARIGFAASIVAKLGVQVRCWSPRDWERQRSDAVRWPRSVGRLGPWQGFAAGKPLEIELGPSACAELRKLGHPHDPVWNDRWPDAMAWSVGALAFEAVQITGLRDRPAVECRAVQSIPTTAVKLGATPKEGRYLANVYWKHWYPWTPRAFRSDECRNGGRLDLHPRSDVWP